MVSDNGIWLLPFFDFFDFHNFFINITYYYLHYLLFNNCNFWITHIHTTSLTNIIYLFLFYQIPHTNLTVKRQAPKDWLCNKEKNKEETSTKIPLVSRGSLPQWGRQFNFCQSSVLWSLMHNVTLVKYSRVCTSLKQRRLKLFAWDLTSTKTPLV